MYKNDKLTVSLLLVEAIIKAKELTKLVSLSSMHYPVFGAN